MVYFPKPGLFKEWGGELLGSFLIAVVTSTVVAVTGGSLAFAVNANQVAITHGFVVLCVMGLLPYVHGNPMITMYMIFNDLICWAKGKEGPLYIFRYLGHLVLQVIGTILASLVTGIYVSWGGPVHLGLTRIPAGIDDGRAFFAIAASSFLVGIVWIIVAENVTPLYNYGMRKLKASYAKENPKKNAGTARKNIYAGQGQGAIFMASLFRAFIVAAITFGITYMTQPIAGYTVNPAHWLGYAIVSGKWESNAWIFALGPLAGFFVAYLVYLPYTLASTWGPFTKYYGRKYGRDKLASTIIRKL